MKMQLMNETSKYDGLDNETIQKGKFFGTKLFIS